MSDYNPYEDVPNVGGMGVGATTPGDENFEPGLVTKTLTRTGSNTVDTVSDTVLNLGPDWLDEAFIILLVLVVMGVVLYLTRPLLGIIEGFVG